MFERIEHQLSIKKIKFDQNKIYNIYQNSKYFNKFEGVISLLWLKNYKILLLVNKTYFTIFLIILFEYYKFKN